MVAHVRFTLFPLIMALPVMLLVQPVQAQQQSLVAKLSFVSSTSNNEYQIQTIDFNGHVSTLLDLSDVYSLPVLSPDGKQIVYLSADNIDTATIVNIASHQKRQSASLGSCPSYSPPTYQFSWSPDGKYIAAYGGKICSPTTAEVYMEDKSEFWDLTVIVPADGSSGENTIAASAFAWSPDGQHIAYTESLPYHFVQIVEASVADAGYKQARVLVKFPITYFHISYMSWSPDGKRLLFLGFLPPPLYGSAPSPITQLYVMNLEVPNPTLMVYSMDGLPQWSPDSKQIAFDYNVIKLDGDYLGHPISHDIRHLLDMPMRDLVWSPDSKQIAFVANPDKEDDIYLIHLDGSGLHRLTQSSHYVSGLNWFSDK